MSSGIASFVHTHTHTHIYIFDRKLETFINALFVLALTFFKKIFIFQRAFSGKLSHFPVFGNTALKMDLRTFYGVWYPQFL